MSYIQKSPTAHEPSYLTQPSLKSPASVPIIIDEELDSLKTLAKNASDEYFETITNLNRSGGLSPTPSIAPLKSHLFRSESTFFNNDSKIQEIRRGRFIGKLLHGVSYNYSLENYQQIITDKIKRISVSNLLPEDMARKMSKTIGKKIAKLELFLMNFQRKSEKSTVFSSFDLNKEKTLVSFEVQRIVRKEVMELNGLLNFLKTSVYFNNRSEEAENTPQVSLGISSDLIYDKIPKPKHENFQFLREEHLRDYINDLHKEKYSVSKLQKLTRLLEYLPQLVFFRLQTEKSELFLAELADLIPSTPFIYPNNPEQALIRCREISRGLILPFDFNFDNPTMLFYNIDNFFQENYQKQGFFLEFNEYILRDERLKENEKNPSVFQDPDQILDCKDSTLKFKKSHWVEDLRFFAETDKFQRQQRVVLDEFFNIRLYNWLKFLTMNNLEHMQMRISRLIRDLKESASQNRDFEELYFEFLSAYYKLLVLKSRNSIAKLLSYLNFFRMIQKDLTTSQSLEIDEKSLNSEKINDKNQREDEEKKFIEKSLFRLFEKQNKFDKYVLSSPVRTHEGLVNIIQDFEKLQKDLYKLDENTIKQAMKSEETKETFFRGLRDDFLINSEDFVILEDFNKEKVVYDAVIHDFFDLADEILKIASFYLHLIEKERKNKSSHVVFKEDRNPLDREEVLQQDEETLLNEILDLECRFHYEKVKYVMKLREVLDNCYVRRERLRISEMIMEIAAKRPAFDLTKNTILESYQLEITNLVTKNQLLGEILDYQRKLEKDTIILGCELAKKTRKTQENEGNEIKSRVSEEKGEKDDIEDIDKAFYLNENDENYEKTDICSIVSELTQEDMMFYFEKIAKFLENLRDSEKILIRFSDSSDSTDTLTRLVLLNLSYQQIGYFWSKLRYNFLLFDDLLDFKFLENDPVLDKPLGYEIFKREFFKQYYERADRPNRETMNKRDNSQRVIRIANNKVLIHRAEFLELMFNYIEFQRLRLLINVNLFQIAFLLDLYKDQLRLFYENPFYMMQAIGISAVIDNFNIFKYFIGLDKLKCSSEIIDLQNWVFYMITPKRMIEPALLLNSLLSLEVLASIGVTLNNLYIAELAKELPNEKDLRKKLKGSARLFFYNIFEKKKRQIYLATTLNLVVTKNLERIRAKLKNKKNLKETLTRMNKLDSSEKKPKRDLAILEMFCTILQKELAFDLMKIQTILIRNQLVKFDKKLPFPKRTFELSPLTTHDYTENLDKELELELKKKQNSAFFDEFGYALNIFIIPSLEEILKIVQLDFDTHQAIEYEEVFYDEDEYRLEEQFLDIKEDSRIPLKKLIERQRKIPLRKVNRLYQRKKHFVNKGFEYLEKTALFIMMNVLFSLHNVLLLEYFMNVLESHPQDIFYLKMGFLESETLLIDNNGKASPIIF